MISKNLELRCTLFPDQRRKLSTKRIAHEIDRSVVGHHIQFCYKYPAGWWSSEHLQRAFNIPYPDNMTSSTRYDIITIILNYSITYDDDDDGVVLPPLHR